MKFRLLLALFFALAGLSTLALLLLFLPPLPLLSSASLSSLTAFEQHQKLSLDGLVVRQSVFDKETRLFLQSGIELRCSRCSLPQLQGTTVSALATVQRFQNKSWLEVIELHSILSESPAPQP